ncbi:MAG: GPW/gp25 family protein, partial [Anaerolineae bacterium]|nr:GPW/gp25 family protein [Anaerolineae bacterium]
VGRWEPRVALQEVTVEGTPDDPRLVAITIQYRLIATQSVERLSLSLQLEG